jgi:single-strand DNA-binding protein
MSLESTLTVAGNLTADPETRQTQEGKTVSRIRLAISQRKFDQQSKQWVDGESIYINAVAFGDIADNIVSTLSKGMRVIINGRLKADSWQDKDSGVTKTDKSIVIEDIGPSLMFAAFSKREKGRESSGGDDSWASSGPVSDETPF